MTNIAWTEKTWNPIAGCTPISPGCTHCYAATMARRLEAMGQSKYAGTATRRGSTDVFTGQINIDESALESPRRIRRPMMWFVNSMSDLFHEDVPTDFIGRIWQVMADCPQHIFQILTKRAARMMCLSCELPRLDNVWLGVSVEDQQRTDRLPYLCGAEAVVRFVSAEPLLSAIDLSHWLPKLHWVIVGGESGRNYRQCEIAWIQSIANQCQSAGVPLFVKQDCGRRPGQKGRLPDNLWARKEFPKAVRQMSLPFCKRAPGANLDV